MTTFLISAIVVLLLLTIVGYFVAGKRQRQREEESKSSENGKETKKETKEKKEGFSFKWTVGKQATAIIILLIAMVVVVLWGPFKLAWGNYPLIICAIIIGALTMLIGGDATKTIRNVRKVALVAIIGLLAWFVIWPGVFKKPDTAPTKQPAPQKQEERIASAPSVQPAAESKKLHATGITLQPGERVRGFKEAGTPAVPLVFRYQDGEKRELPASFWKETEIVYSHTGQAVTGRSAELLVRGPADKYRFEKL